MFNKQRLASRNKEGQKPAESAPIAKHSSAQMQRGRYNLATYVQQHKQACLASLLRLRSAPFASLMTLLVIGIAIALPAFLYVLLNNAVNLSHGWNDNARISLYLNQNVGAAQSVSLVKEIQAWPEVAKVIYISPEQGLNEFAKQSGLAVDLTQLPSNPLPGVIEVQPIQGLTSSAGITDLLARLKAFSAVQHAQVDMQWVQRLYGILDVGQSGVYALAFLLGLGVLLIVGNTIRLATQSYHAEIETIKLVGGTDAFIRRPFLYTGLFYGLFGGVIAWALVSITMLSLQVSARHLAVLYNSHFAIHSLDFLAGFILLFLAGVLGLLGSWFVVNRHLLEVEPT